MNISAPFIQRPITTALLMIGLLVGGLVSYPLLPVAALPNVNYPTLQFGQIPGLTQMTSASALGFTQITLQFDLSRAIDGAVSDTLSAINAASAYLPLNLPYPPTIRKVNPADTPILVRPSKCRSAQRHAQQPASDLYAQHQRSAAQSRRIR